MNMDQVHYAFQQFFYLVTFTPFCLPRMVWQALS
jgi:hypothetical protein